ncbi:hypothetical protein QOT17_002445 [Balamuthia mandrillaris]
MLTESLSSIFLVHTVVVALFFLLGCSPATCAPSGYLSEEETEELLRLVERETEPENIIALVERQGLPADFMDPTVPGATCVHRDNVTMSYPCHDFLNYTYIYVDRYQAIRNAYAAGVLGSVPNAECRLRSSRYLCPTYFRECTELTAPADAVPVNASLSNKVAVGGYVCRELCRARLDACVSSVKPADRPQFLNCNVFNTLLFGPTTYNIFPDPNDTYTVTAPNGVDITYVDQCYDDSANVFYNARVECPFGTFQLEPGVCGFSCPEPLIEDDEFDAVTIMMSVMGWLSFVLMAFLVVTYLVDPEKRKFPNHLPLFLFLAVMCFSFAFCLASTLPNDHRDMICKNEQEANYFGDGACTVQGLLVVYFFFAAVLWWLVICFNIFLMLVLAAKQVDYRRSSVRTLLMVSYHCFAWLLPFVPVIISLAAERLGANGSDLWCTIHSSSEDNRVVLQVGSGAGVTTAGESTNAWNFGLFWSPIILFIVIGISFIFVVILFQLRQESGWKGFVKFISGQWRIFAFLALYIWVCVFLFASQLDFEAKRNEQYDDYATYTACLFQRNAGLEVDAALKELTGKGLNHLPEPCTLETNVNYPLWVIAAFNFVGQGVFVFFIFGTSARVYKLWWSVATMHTLPKASNSITLSGDAVGGTTSRTGGKVTKVKGKQLAGGSLELDSMSDGD